MSEEIITETADAGFVAQDGSFTEGWIDRLGDEFSDSREQLEKFKTLPDVLKSYSYLEKKIGAKGVILPTEKSTPEEVSAYRRAMGIPDTVEGYELKPEKLPEGMTWNDEVGRQFAEIAHEHGVPAKAMRALAERFATWQEGTLKAAMDDHQAQVQRGTEQLQREWGGRFEANINKAVTVANRIGLDPRSPGLSDPAVVKALVKFSDMVSESRFVGGEPHTGMQGGMERARDIMTNASNPLYERYQRGEAEAVRTVRELMGNG